jgi:hypothetical protein
VLAVPSTIMEACSPSGVSAANSGVLGPRLRGAWATARSPRGAQPYRGVRARLQPLSSTKTSVSALNAWSARARQAARSASSRSLACRLIFFMTPAQHPPEYSRKGGLTDLEAVRLAQPFAAFD